MDDEVFQTVNKPPANEYSKFGRDIIWITASQIFVSIILGILVLPALTRHYSQDLYTTWVLVNIVVALLAPLVSLQLGLAAVKFLAGQDDRGQRQRFLGSMLTASFIVAAIVILAGIPFSGWISNRVFAGSASYYWLALAWTFFNSIYNLLLAYLQARCLNRTIAMIQIAITTAKVAFIVGVALAGASLQLLIASQIAIQAFFCLVLLLIVTRETGFPVFGFAGLKTFLSFSLPQIPSFVLLWTIMMSDRLFIEFILGTDRRSEVGIYQNSMTLAGLSALFYFPVSFVLFSLLSRFWAQKRLDEVKSYFEYSLKLFLTIAIPGAVGIAMLSQQLLKMLTTSDYLAGKWLVFLLTLGLVLYGVYQMNTNLILLGKRSKNLPWLVASGAITFVLGCLIMIPRLGIIGAAYGGVAAYLVLAVISTFWAKSVASYKLDLIFYLKIIAASALMWLGLTLIKINDIWGLIEAVIFGIVIYGASVFTLRAFSSRDFNIAKQIIANVLPGERKNS